MLGRLTIRRLTAVALAIVLITAALVMVAILVLVGVGQLGVVGILLGLALLIVAMPSATVRS